MAGAAGDVWDVAVVGYGPVGALAALLLAHEGLRVVVLERDSAPVELPRAVALDGESLRAFQRIGLGDAVHALVQPPRDPDEVWFTDSKRQKLFGLTLPPQGHNGWRDVMYFDQPELEALLRERVAAEPLVDVRPGHEVMDVAQAADAVAIRARSEVGAHTLRAAYAIGCDGASSFVRRHLGVACQSLGYDQDWLVVDVVQGPEAALPPVMMQVCDPARLTTYVCPKDPNRRWEFQLLPGETREQMLRPETIEALLDAWLPRAHYTLRRAAVYQFHAATASRWQVGRVFLAGDAAHQTPPFLGQGLNAGFRDVANLAWKLARVLRGSCAPELLASYADERDAHARDLVEWAVMVGKLMETLAAREAGRPDPHPGVDQRAGYGQGRTAPPLRGGVLMEPRGAAASSASRAASPVGSLLRQPTVRCADGRVCRLDDLLGPGFALVARRSADLRLSAEATRTLQRLGARTLALDGLEPVEGRHDPLFDRCAAAIVRPDRYVFGVTDEGSVEALLQELARRVCLR